MDLMLILLPCWGMSAPPLGLASLCAYLRDKGLDVLALDLNVNIFRSCRDEYKKFWLDAEHEFWRSLSSVELFIHGNNDIIDLYIKQICDSDAKVVGFSIYDTSMVFSLIMAKKVKEKCPDKLIVFGGPHCSRYMAGDYIIMQEGVDVLVEGEGEVALFEIVESIKKGNKIEYCAGARIKIKGEVIKCADRLPVENLDLLPFPDFGDFIVENYLKKGTLPTSTSRGCVNRCVFCNEWPFWKKYRYKTGFHLFKEIKYQLFRYPSVVNFEFCDSLLNGNLKELSIFCDLVIEDKLFVHWGGQAIIHRGMSSELLLKLKKAGCTCLDYGFESGSQKVIDKMRKGFRVLDAERVIRQTFEAGIDVVINVMFGNPSETEEDFEKTLDFVLRNKKYIAIVNPSPSFCGIAPGTYLYDHPEEFDIAVPIDHAFFWKLNDNSNDYLVRLDRFERFCVFVDSNGIESTYPYTTLANRYKIVGDYYFHFRDYSKALTNYRISIDEEGQDAGKLRLINECQKFLS